MKWGPSNIGLKLVVFTEIMEGLVFSFDSFREFLTQRHWQEGAGFPYKKAGQADT